MTATRLAIVVSHPIQYYAPWFRHLAQQPDLEVRVFHLWDFGVTAQVDRGFGQTVQWDIPLLDGYPSEFVPNVSRDPGTHHFRGLDNPELVPRLLAWKPDAILLFGYAYLSHLRVILSRRLHSVPLLFRGDSHDLARPPGWRTRFSRLARKLLFRRFAGVLAVGRANEDYFRNCGVPEARIHRVPHCVDNARFQAAAPEALGEAVAWRRELGIPGDALVYLFVGKLEAKKRPLDLLAAFKRLGSNPGKADSQAVLLYVGSGEEEDQLRNEAGSTLGKTVFLAPFQNQSAMAKVYAAGDVLVLPSCSESETWGLAVNEAMNLGRPAIVSSQVGCGPDLIREGETGWTFPAGDVGALAGILGKAHAAGREGLAILGARAREQLAGYSYEAATDRLLMVLGRLPLRTRVLADT